MRWSAQLFIAGIVSVGLLTGCPGREVAEVTPTPTKEEFKDIPIEVNRDIDILFVIDNSGSMEDEQNSLAANFNRFVNVLENIDGGLPNVHIGVISTDLGSGPFSIAGCGGGGDNGTLQNTPRGACQAPNGGAFFIEDLALPDMTRQKNYNGTLEETFSCIARLGIDGCGFEQPLESMRRALNGSNPTNSNFLRDGAFLAVIFVADEDDCSVSNTSMFDTSQTTIDSPLGPLTSFRCFEFGVQCEPDNPRSPGPKANCTPRQNSEFMYGVQEYVDFLKGLKSDPNLLIVAAITGNAAPVNVTINADTNPELVPSCVVNAGTPQQQNAAPSVRLTEFVNAFPQRGTAATICNEDQSDALILIAQLLAKVIGNPCLEGDLTDVDLETPGVQANCQVSDVINPGTDGQQEIVLRECSSATPPESEYPCWHLIADPSCSDTPTGLALKVEPENREVPTGTHLVARCQVN